MALRGIDAAPAPSPGRCSRPHGGAAPEQVAGLTNQISAADSRTLYCPWLTIGDAIWFMLWPQQAAGEGWEQPRGAYRRRAKGAQAETQKDEDATRL